MHILKILLSNLIVLVTPLLVFAQPYENLSELQTRGAYTSSIIHYNEKITQVINELIKAEHHDVVKAVITRIDETSDERYLIIFDPGPSGDPRFIVYHIVHGEEKEIASISGAELFIPGNGSVYSIGMANEYFIKRRKYSLRQGRLEEVVQPFYYVGLKTQTNQPVDLYDNLDYKNKVAHLPENYDVEVLINKDDNYLVKTPLGLAGWAKLRNLCGYEKIRSICFHGD